MKGEIIIRNFQYTYSVGRFTIKAYKEEYHNSLIDFLNEYEDNTEALYLHYLIPEWNELIIEFTNAVESIKNNDNNDGFYFIRNRIYPDGLPDKEDSQEVKAIQEKLVLEKGEDEDENEYEEKRISLYKELTEIWKKENEIEEKEDEENWRFPNWREVENKELEKRDCIKLLNRNIATGFLFIDFLKNRQIEIKTQQVEPIPLINPKEPTEVKPFEFKNKFDHVTTSNVYYYFKTELVDANYLSLEDLQKYLIMAFQDKTVPNEKFKIEGEFTITIIRSIFYKYYNKHAQDKHGLKMDYCKLLGEYFNGFDSQKLHNNFR